MPLKEWQCEWTKRRLTDLDDVLSIITEGKMVEIILKSDDNGCEMTWEQAVALARHILARAPKAITEAA